MTNIIHILRKQWILVSKAKKKNNRWSYRAAEDPGYGTSVPTNMVTTRG